MCYMNLKEEEITNNPNFHYPFENWDHGIVLSWLFWIINIVQIIAVMYIPFALDFGFPLTEEMRKLGTINLLIASSIIIVRIVGAVTIYIIQERKNVRLGA